MIQDEGLGRVVGEAFASFAHEGSALNAALAELTADECTRANILGAAGVLGWAVAFHGGPDGGSTVAAELTQRIALLLLIACYSGGMPARTLQQKHDRLYFKAEICIERAARAEQLGILDVADALRERAGNLQLAARRYREV